MRDSQNSDGNKPPDEERSGSQPPSGSYYYDDSTGYELYDTERDNDDDELNEDRETVTRNDVQES